jgi:hypothetical protein
MRALDYRHVADDLLSVVEVDQPSSTVREMFSRLFNASVPDFPRHFEARYLPAQTSVGYVHFTALDDVYLCGGLCLDTRAYKQMPASDRARIGQAGGIAEIMLRACFSDLTDKQAVFGYCGDLKALRVDLRAGFQKLDHPYLLVRWTREMTEGMKASLTESVHRLGPF